jgi:ABC-type multidrug transport system ATPase subunit
VLDDVISAVDAHTSQHIIQKCFKSDLMAGRTVIIASHAVESLADLAHRALFLEDGTVAWQGTGPELLETEYMSHLKTERSTAQAENSDIDADLNEPEPSAKRKASLANTMEADQFDVRRAPARTPRQILVEEKRDKGTVAFRHWFELMKMNGGPIYFTAFSVFTLVSVLGPVAERHLLK